MAYDTPFEDRKKKYSTFLSARDPGTLSNNLNRLVGAFSPEEKQRIWSDSGQTTPFQAAPQKQPANRWGNRLNGWSAPDGQGRRYQIGGQPSTAGDVQTAWANAGKPPVQDTSANPSPFGPDTVTQPGSGPAPVGTPIGINDGATVPGVGLLQNIQAPQNNQASIPEVNRTGFKNDQFGFDPTLGSVNQNTDTVAGQLRGLLSQDSPFITRARTSAAQAANARGLSNSSMAAGAGEAAAIDAATPIAAADAGTFSAQRLANQTAANAAKEVGATEANKAYLLEASSRVNQQLENLKARNISQLSAQEANQLQTLTAQKGEIDRQLQMLVGSQQSTLQSERFAQQAKLNIDSDAAAYARQQLQGDQAANLADIEGSNRALIQSNAGASNMYMTMIGNINSIMGNPDLKPEDKDRAVRVQQDLLRSGLSVIGSSANVDYVSLLNWSGGIPSTTSTTGDAGKINLSGVFSRLF